MKLFQIFATALAVVATVIGGAEANPDGAAASAPEKAAAVASPSVTWPAAGKATKLAASDYASVVSGHPSDILVVNFWATWCAPCVEELPHFVKLAKELDPDKIAFVGMSLDFPKDLEAKVNPFLVEKGIPYPNFLLEVDDPDPFIEAISKNWNGNIPATFVYDPSGKVVAEVLQQVEEEELREFVTKAAAKAAAAKAPASEPPAADTSEAAPAKEAEEAP